MIAILFIWAGTAFLISLIISVVVESRRQVL